MNEARLYEWSEKVKECPIGSPFSHQPIELSQRTINKILQLIAAEIPEDVWLYSVELKIGGNRIFPVAEKS